MILATFDFETDPFKQGRSVRPFVWDFYDGETHTHGWSADCCDVFIRFLEHEIKHGRRYVIYAHNGGRFDFLFLLKHVRGKRMLVIGNRIVEAELCGHVIRDSYAQLPGPLKDMQKDEGFDYSILEADVRDRHRQAIMTYLEHDTEGLFKYVSAYRKRFGANARTMAGAAIKELQKFHSFERMTASNDAHFREYFHGGRVECFETGIIEDDLRIYDVNSMYPAVMHDLYHPVSASAIPGTRIHPKTCFVDWSGKSRGAMAVKYPDESLRFPHREGRFKCSIHEFEAGLETGTIQVDKIHQTWDFLKRIRFDEFIANHYTLRMDARASGDKVNDLFEKLTMNSSYGKFAQDPTRFQDYLFTGITNNGRWQGPSLQCWCPTENCNCGGWKLASPPGDGYMLWKRPTKDRSWRGFYNVATAASITGAARARLLKALVKADRPLYCDTDSIICRGLSGSGIIVDPGRLGAWKQEHSGFKAAIAGKKLYAFWDHEPAQNKLASKGAKLSMNEIERVARGEEITYTAEAPSIRLDGVQSVLERRIKRTAALPDGAQNPFRLRRVS